MRINADFSQRAVVHAATLPWQASPEPGVERRMLDRIGGEVARATSIVRYAPGSRFAPHMHEAGEEFLVLDGVFQDEHGDYPAGTYVRNPPHSRHVPRSEQGCTIFVKLRQFDAQDRTPVNVNTAALPLRGDANRAGVQFGRLHRDAREDVRIEHWAANAQIELAADGGLELLVLEGGFIDQSTRDQEPFVAQSWLRAPPGDVVRAHGSGQGCVLWVKQGHLR